jgi:hypothetical protein
MALADGLDALDQRRAARSTKRRLPPARHPKAAAAPADIQPAGQASAPAVEPEITPPGPTEASPDAAETSAGAQRLPEPVPRRRSRVRATQVHLDERADDHLTELRKRAVLADVDLTSSAVLRLALTEFVDRHGYDGIVRLFAEDDSRIRRGRPQR